MALMQTDLPGCDFVAYFYEILVIDRLTDLACRASSKSAQEAIQALAVNMPQFEPEIIRELLDAGFLARFADYYNEMSSPVEFLDALTCIVECVNLMSESDVAVIFAFRVALVQFGLWDELDAILESLERTGDYSELDMQELGVGLLLFFKSLRDNSNNPDIGELGERVLQFFLSLGDNSNHPKIQELKNELGQAFPSTDNSWVW
jgi:hypothetical protein